MEVGNVDDYNSSLLAERAQWIERLSRHAPQDPLAKEQAAKRFNSYLASARHHARRNQTFVQRAHLRADIAREIDRHCAAAEYMRASVHIPEDVRAALCDAREAECARLVSQPGAWVAMELKIIEKTGSETRLGMQVGMQLSTETGSQGEHQLASLKAPPV